MKRTLITILGLALLVAPQLAFGDDVDDLKDAEGRLFRAMNSFDTATLTSLLHPGAAIFPRDSAFATVVPMQLREIREMMSTVTNSMSQNVELLNINPVNMEYRVIGNVGMVWGYNSVEEKLKDGPPQTTEARISQTWLKTGGIWQLLMMHASAIPSGD
jgi:ketosteroid isomerase-like protein